MHQADGDNAGQRPAEDRQQAQRHQPQRAVNGEEHGDDGQGADQRQPGDIALDGRPCLHGEAAGAGELQAEAVGVLAAGGFGEGALDGLDGCELTIGVGAERPRLDQQHRPLAVARGPHAFAAFRLGTGVEAAEQRIKFAGWVAGQIGLEQHCGR